MCCACPPSAVARSRSGCQYRTAGQHIRIRCIAYDGRRPGDANAGPRNSSIVFLLYGCACVCVSACVRVSFCVVQRRLWRTFIRARVSAWRLTACQSRSTVEVVRLGHPRGKHATYGHVRVPGTKRRAALHANACTLPTHKHRLMERREELAWRLQ